MSRGTRSRPFSAVRPDGPAAIRAVLRCESSNTWNEDIADVATLIDDAANLPLEDAPDPQGLIASTARDLTARMAAKLVKEIVGRILA